MTAAIVDTRRMPVVAAPHPFTQGEVLWLAPGTLQDLFQSLPKAVSGPQVKAWVNSVEVPRIEWDNLDVDEDDRVVFVVVPRGPALPVLIDIGVALLVSIGVSLIARKLFAPPDPAKERDDERSPTYSLRGIRQNRSEGLPMEVIYGRIRVGGTLVGEYVEALSSPEPSVTLYQLVSFGWGPIKSIAGIEVDTPPETELDGSELGVLAFIEDNPIENYEGIKSQVRLGNNVQSAIRGFEQVRVPNAVGPFDLTSEVDDDEDNDSLASTFSNSGSDAFDQTNDAHWAEHGSAFDIVEPVDEVVFRLAAPEGYHGTDQSSGNLTWSSFWYQVRYLELDNATNLPITSGGTSADGYVRRRPVTSQAFRRQGSFEFEVRVPLLDPQTVPAAAQLGPGNASRTVAGVDYIEAPDIPSPQPSSGTEIDKLSFSFWWRMVSMPAAGNPSVGDWVWLGGVWDDGSRRGFGIGLEYRVYNQLGNPVNRWTLTVLSAYGGGFQKLQEKGSNGDQFPPATSWDTPELNNPQGDGPVWRHSGMTYRKSDFLRVYHQGALRETVGTGVFGTHMEWHRDNLDLGYSPEFSSDIVVPGGGTLRSPEVHYDQPVVWDDSLSSSEMAAQFNDGEGSTNYFGSTVSAHTFDVDGTQEISNGWWGTFVPAGGGSSTVASVAGVVLSAPIAGTPKRMKVRAEIVRINLDSDNAYTRDKVEWFELAGIIDAKFVYPRQPLLAHRIPASEQLNSSLPESSTIVEGRLVPVVKSLEPLVITSEWSANPAWICLDLLINTDYGMGRDYTIADLRRDLPALKAWADYADEYVYDGTLPISFDHDADLNGAFEDATWYADGTHPTLAGEVLEVSIPRLNSDTGPTFVHEILPVTWTAGGRMRLRNFPTPADDVDVFEEINIPVGSDGSDSGAYEILDVIQTSTGAAWIVQLRSEIGTAPWHNADLGLTLRAAIATTGGGVTGLDGAVLETGEHRFEFNGVFDSQGNAWDALLKIAAVGRAMPVKESGSVRFRYQHPRVAEDVVTSAMMKPGSFRLAYSSPRSKPNSLDLTILDRDQRYEQVPVSVASPLITNPTDGSQVRQDQSFLFGVTSKGQASRAGRFEINSAELQRRGGDLALLPATLGLEAGDVIRVSHDVLPRGVGGLVVTDNAGDPVGGLIVQTNDLTDAAWTASDVTVGASATTELGSPAFSVDDTNAAALGYIGQVAKTDFGDTGATGTPLTHGPYVATIVAEPISGQTQCRLFVRTSSNQGHWVAFRLTGSGLILAEGGGSSGGGRIQRLGATDSYILTVWADFLPERPVDTIEFRFYPATGSTGEDVTDTGAMRVGDPSLTYGKHPAFPLVSRRGLVLDRRVTIAAGDLVYVSRVDPSTGRKQIASGTVDPTVTTAGTYEPGDAIFSESNLVDGSGQFVVPSRQDQYIVVTPGNELQLEILGATLRDDLGRTFEVVEYNEGVYDDRADDQTLTLQSISDDEHGGISGLDGTSARLPGEVEILFVADYVVLTAQGDHVTQLRVGWSPRREDLALIARTEVWVRLATDRAEDRRVRSWELAGSVSGSTTFLVAELPVGRRGAVVEVAVSPVLRSGKRRAPEGGAIARHRVIGLPISTPAPMAGLEVALQGRLVVYGWRVPVGQERVALECRRGGWIMGQPVFRSTPGAEAEGPSVDWAGSSYGTPRLYFRSVDQAGAHSDATVVGFNPAPHLNIEAPRLDDRSQQWELFDPSNGWVRVTPSTGDPSIGAEFQQSAGKLEWDPASTAVGVSTVYTTREPGVQAIEGDFDASGREARLAYVEAYFECEQVHPVTWDDWDVAWGDPSFKRWTWEGPLELVDNEENGRMWIEMRVNETGADEDWSEWIRYRPGVYSLVEVQFRIRAYRPTSAYGFNLTKFHTRVSAPRLTIEQRPPIRAMLDSESF